MSSCSGTERAVQTAGRTRPRKCTRRQMPGLSPDCLPTQQNHEEESIKN